MAEAGVANFVAGSLERFYGPKGMPSEAVKVLKAAVTTILQDPDTVAKFKSIGFDVIEMALQTSLESAWRMKSTAGTW